MKGVLVCLIVGLVIVGVVSQHVDDVTDNTSVKATPGYTNKGKMGCFAANTRVITSRGVKMMKDLVLGDDLLIDFDTPDTIYEKGEFAGLVSWLHRDSTVTGTFLDIVSRYGSVTLTPEHYLYASEGCDGHYQLHPAKDIRIGWCLRSAKCESPVESIETVEMEGVYAPYVTKDLFYVVNGKNLDNAIAVSPYAVILPNEHQKKMLSLMLTANTMFFEHPDTIQGMPLIIRWVLDYAYWFMGV